MTCPSLPALLHTAVGRFTKAPLISPSNNPEKSCRGCWQQQPEWLSEGCCKRRDAQAGGLGVHQEPSRAGHLLHAWAELFGAALLTALFNPWRWWVLGCRGSPQSCSTQTPAPLCSAEPFRKGKLFFSSFPSLSSQIRKAAKPPLLQGWSQGSC